jgi:hypothetical protein
LGGSEDRKLASENTLRDQACGSDSPLLYHGSDYKIVFTVAIARVIGIKGIDVRADFAWNLRQDPFLKKSLPLCWNGTIDSRFLRVRGTRLNSN